ncbi:oxidoreductase [Sesbania bispinosa]|nr:oxidoreductase [Sesbania bispinosa]
MDEEGRLGVIWDGCVGEGNWVGWLKVIDEEMGGVMGATRGVGCNWLEVLIGGGRLVWEKYKDCAFEGRSRFCVEGEREDLTVWGNLAVGDLTVEGEGRCDWLDPLGRGLCFLWTDWIDSRTDVAYPTVRRVWA